MKRKIIITIAVLLSLPFMLSAQSSEFRAFFDKYAGVKGYTTVEMSGAMFRVINASSNDKSGDGSDLLDQIDNLIIVVSEGGSAQFRNDIRALSSSKVYTPMTVIRDGEDTVEFYVIQKAGKMCELLMIVDSDDDSVVMLITGDNLDVKQMSKMVRKTGVNLLD